MGSPRQTARLWIVRTDPPEAAVEKWKGLTFDTPKVGLDPVTIHVTGNRHAIVGGTIVGKACGPRSAVALGQRDRTAAAIDGRAVAGE